MRDLESGENEEGLCVSYLSKIVFSTKCTYKGVCTKNVDPVHKVGAPIFPVGSRVQLSYRPPSVLYGQSSGMAVVAGAVDQYPPVPVRAVGYLPGTYPPVRAVGYLPACTASRVPTRLYGKSGTYPPVWAVGYIPACTGNTIYLVNCQVNRQAPVHTRRFWTTVILLIKLVVSIHKLVLKVLKLHLFALLLRLFLWHTLHHPLHQLLCLGTIVLLCSLVQVPCFFFNDRSYLIIRQ
jgi:hypothetical protein